MFNWIIIYYLSSSLFWKDDISSKLNLSLALPLARSYIFYHNKINFWLNDFFRIKLFLTLYYNSSDLFFKSLSAFFPTIFPNINFDKLPLYYLNSKNVETPSGFSIEDPETWFLTSLYSLYKTIIF